MFLKHEQSGKMVEVLSMMDLMNPTHDDLVGRFHAGEELQDPENFAKSDLVFPSGEKLPQCWMDLNYRDSGHHYHRPN